jgi:hypothetical protein
MAIALKCPNGHALAVAEEHAGKRVMCPTCRSILDVPLNGPAVSISLTCPNGHALTTPREHAGKKVKCPMCQAIAEVPSTRAAPPPLPPGAYTAASQDRIREGKPLAREDYGDVTFEEEDKPRRIRPRAEREEEEEDRPRKRRRRRDEEYEDEYEEDARPRSTSGGMKKRQRMKLIQLGLGFHYAGLVIVLVCMVVSLLMPLLMLSGAGLYLVGVLNILMFIAYLAVPGLWMAGSVLCLFVPPKSGAFPLILASVILNGVAIASLLVLWILLGPLAVLGVFASLAAWVCFMLFLRNLATYLREHGCADEAMQLLYLGIGLIVAIVVFVGLLFVLAMPMQSPPWLLMILALVGGITLLVFEIKFLLRNLGLIGTLRQTVASRG